MKIQGVNIVASGVDSFLQASFKGKMAAVVSVITLIYLMSLWLSRSFCRDGASTSLGGRAEPMAGNAAKTIQELPTPDLSYIKGFSMVPDFVRVPPLSKWMLEKNQELTDLREAAAAGNQECRFWTKMNQVKRNVELQVESMRPLFNKIPNFDESHLEKFFEKSDLILRENDLNKSCDLLKECLKKLEDLDEALKSAYQDQFIEQVNDKNKYPHYEFTNLQTQYFHYLGLRTKDDFTNHLSTEFPALADVGLVQMEDVDALELRTMMPSIEKLRQLFCYLEIAKEAKKAGLGFLIEEEIDKCRAVLKDSDDLSGVLTNSQRELRDIVRLMRTSFGNLFHNYSDALTQLAEIEKLDITRQLILLKGYIHQPNLRATCVANKVTQLSQYAKGIDNQSLTLLYQMGQ